MRSWRWRGRVTSRARRRKKIRGPALAKLLPKYPDISVEIINDDKGRLVRVLADWSAPMSGYHLYYPSRRQPTPAFTLLVDTLRYRG